MLTPISKEGKDENTITRNTGNNKIREHLRCEVLDDDLNKIAVSVVVNTNCIICNLKHAYSYFII